MKLVGGVEVEDEVDHLLVADRQLQPVHPWKRVGCGERRALVSVKEWVVLGKAFPQSGCLLNEVCVIPALGTKYRSLQQSLVAHASGPATAADLILVDREDIAGCEVVCHSASLL